MSLSRRPLGRSRSVAALGAVIVLVGCVLPWWTVGGTEGLPVRSGNAFDAWGILVFVAALATIALFALPYATERPLAADSWLSYLIAAAVGWGAFALRVLDLAGLGYFSLNAPLDAVMRSPGLWVVLAGLVVIAQAVLAIASAERDR